jgi:hypothetical protein
MMSKNAGTTPVKNKWAERLRGRTRMAVAAIGGVFIIGLMIVARPLSQRIDGANERLAKAEGRMMLASDVYDLRKQSGHYKKKVPRGVDLNDWTYYLLEGIRTQKVKLTKMEPKKQMSLGPCKILTWNIEMSGSFEALSHVVEWMENGERLVRLDKLMMQMHGGKLSMSLVLKGIVLDVPPEKGPTKKKPPEEIITRTDPEP